MTPGDVVDRTHKVALHVLPPRTKIVLISCSTGEQPDDGECNIAEHWQVLAGPHRQVYAPRAPIKGGSLEMMNDEDPTFAFHDCNAVLGDITFRPDYNEVIRRTGGLANKLFLMFKGPST